jgi:hypothetical protein
MTTRVFYFLLSLLLTASLALVSSSCKHEDPITTMEIKEYNVRYEATCSNPALYKIRVTYAIVSSLAVHEIKGETVESPFTFEAKMKSPMPASISASLVYKGEGIDPKDDNTVKVAIYVDETLKKEAQSNDNVLVSVILGVD